MNDILIVADFELTLILCIISDERLSDFQVMVGNQGSFADNEARINSRNFNEAVCKEIASIPVEGYRLDPRAPYRRPLAIPFVKVGQVEQIVVGYERTLA